MSIDRILTHQQCVWVCPTVREGSRRCGHILINTGVPENEITMSDQLMITCLPYVHTNDAKYCIYILYSRKISEVFYFRYFRYGKPQNENQPVHSNRYPSPLGKARLYWCYYPSFTDATQAPASWPFLNIF